MYMKAPEAREVTMPDVPHLRSALFVPGHRADFIAKGLESTADALIIDLEDSVSPTARDAARDRVRELVSAPAHGPMICVRVHAVGHSEHEADLAAASGPGLLAVVLPKVCDETVVRTVAASLGSAVLVWPLLESARAVQNSARIASASDRVAYLGGGTSNGGDLAADLGFTWTADGFETLYLRSKVLLDARAAGVPYPMTGVVTERNDLAVVQDFARQSRRLGYDGLMVIHPSHVPIANRVFGATPEQRQHAAAVVAALDEAATHGDGAATVDGRMVDAAMRITAEAVLRRRPASD
jgi:citrate lyase subunit beta / citryl-CoA lyase